jgi:arsenate reductase-like glutaredoxin family protein
MVVQIYGTQKSQDSKKALRFFKERNIDVQFFDLKTHSMSLGELSRFIQKFGLLALINSKAKAYEKAGLEYMRVSDEQMIDKLIDYPNLMNQPLVRSGNDLAIGWQDSVWKDWYKNRQT